MVSMQTEKHCTWEKNDVTTCEAQIGSLQDIATCFRIKSLDLQGKDSRLNVA